MTPQERTELNTSLAAFMGLDVGERLEGHIWWEDTRQSYSMPCERCMALYGLSAGVRCYVAPPDYCGDPNEHQNLLRFMESRGFGWSIACGSKTSDVEGVYVAEFWLADVVNMYREFGDSSLVVTAIAAQKALVGRIKE